MCCSVNYKFWVAEANCCIKPNSRPITNCMLIAGIGLKIISGGE